MEVLDYPNHTTLFSFKLFILFWGITDWFGFPDGSDSKESTCNVRDLGSIPGLWRSPGGGHGNPPQYPCLGNSHGQRSLAGNSPRGCKVGHDWATKHSIALNRLTTNVVIVLGEQRRDSSIHNHVSILPQIPLTFRLPPSRVPWQPLYFLILNNQNLHSHCIPSIDIHRIQGYQ